jgi:DNA-binding response OmpR family regulator
MAHVVVVEDEPLIVTMLEINLRRNGHEVTCFQTAEALLEFIDQNSCDIILLDIMLPGMNGDEALQVLRGQGVRTPVLMLTARQELAIKVKTLGAGADDYLAKPFDMEELLVRIQALLRRTPD